MRRCLSAVFFCCTALALSAAESFSFVRPVRSGNIFECRIRLTRSARYSFSLPSREEPVVKLDTVDADFFGYLTVREVNAAGNPVRLLISRGRFSGVLNGRPVEPVKEPLPDIEADLSGKTAVFFSADKTLSNEQLILLQSLFPPASTGTLADLTGRSRELSKPGESWSPVLKPFLDLLKQRQVELPASAFRSGITYQGKEQIGKLDCRKFTLLIETSRLTDFDCRYRFSFALAPSGPPVRMVRDAEEVIRRVLRSGEPMSAGTKLELISRDHTDQSLYPISEIPPPKSEKKKSGAWDFLLR